MKKRKSRGNQNTSNNNQQNQNEQEEIKEQSEKIGFGVDELFKIIKMRVTPNLNYEGQKI